MKKIFAIALSVSVLFPLVTTAAQPTASTIIRQSLRSWGTKTTERGQAINVRVAVDYQKNYYDKKKAPDQYVLRLQSNSTDFPINELQSNSEITYSLPKLLVKSEGQTIVDATNAFSADARVFPVEKAIYVRLNSLDRKAADFLAEIGFQTDPIINQWIKFTLDDTKDLLGSGEASALSLDTLTDKQELAELRAWYLANEIKYGAPVIVSSNGRITKNAAGEKIQTVRVVPNARWYGPLEALLVKEYKKNNPEATAAEVRAYQKEFKADLLKFKQAMTKVNVQVTVNLTTAKIVGVGVVFKDSRIAYRTDYKYVRGKDVSKKVAEGRESIAVSGGVSWAPAVSAALGEPKTALTPEAAWNLISPASTSTFSTDRNESELN